MGNKSSKAANRLTLDGERAANTVYQRLLFQVTSLTPVADPITKRNVCIHSQPDNLDSMHRLKALLHRLYHLKQFFQRFVQGHILPSC